MRKEARGLALLLLPAGLLLSQTRPASPVQLYVDVANGVSFAYPTGWALTRPLDGYLPDPVTSPEHPAIAAVSLTSGYPGTNFAGAELIYSVHGNATESSCKAVLREIESPTTQVSVGKLPYYFAHARDTAAGHEREDRVYTTLHDGRCYVFDLAMMTATSRTASGVQALSGEQQDEVKRQLDSILGSVTFHGAPAPKRSTPR